MICSNCKKTIADDALFCNYCGTKVEAQTEESAFCTGCGAKLQPGDAFCAKCGKKAPGQAAESEIAEEDPWAELDGKKNDPDDPWAGFQDSFETETKIEEKIVEVVKYVEVPSQAGKSETKNGGFNTAAFRARADEILPMKRGNSKTKKLDQLIAELEAFANNGVLDAMLMLPALCAENIQHDKSKYWKEAAVDAGADDPELILQVGSDNYLQGRFQKAHTLFERVYKQGNATAAYWLYELYNNPQYSGVNQNTSLRYFNEAIRLGYDINLYRWIGDRYFYGKGITAKDPAEAIKYYRKGAELGCAGAEYMLGEAYLCGSGVTKDMPKAVEIFKKISAGSNEAEIRLAECYMFGWGIEKNYTEALRIAKKHKSTFIQCNQAQYLLGYAYRYGLGVTQNLETAKKHLKNSCDDRAKKLLAEM